MKHLIFAALVCVILCGCNKMAPKCNSTEVKDAVLEIVWDQMATQLSASELNKLKSDIELEIKVIRTTDVNKNTGKYSCAANLISKNKTDGSKIKQLPITYTSENADEDRFYVEVYGL